MFIACAGKIFCENPGKNFRGNCSGKNPVKLIIAGVEIFANGILWKGWKPTADVRGSGSFDNPGLGNLNIAKGCDRMVERSWGKNDF